MNTKSLAHLFLVLSLTLYIVSSLFESAYPVLSWLKSFSEAASVGAIADWFAVTALFRHPLGIPIPHTAIVARQRSRLARGLGEFIDRNFLSPEVLRRKIVEENLAFKSVQWFSGTSSPTGTESVLQRVIPRMVRFLDDPAFAETFREQSSILLRQVSLAPLCGRVLRYAVEADTSQELATGIIIQIRNILQQNRAEIERFVAGKLPWYIPEFIHRPAFRDLVGRIAADIEQIEQSPAHPFRGKLREYLYQLAEHLENDPSLLEQGERIKAQLLSSDLLKDFFSQLFQNLKAALEHRDSLEFVAISNALTTLGVALVSRLHTDEDLQRALNELVFDAISSLNTREGLKFARLVEEVVASWDTGTVVARIEEQVSNDLQFIRINGTIIGGLIGVLLHAVHEFVLSGQVIP